MIEPPSFPADPAPRTAASPLVRARRWWAAVTFGAGKPRRRVTALAGFGLIAGLGEAAVVVLLVALASQDSTGRLPFFENLPSGTWALAAMALIAIMALAAAHFGSAWTSTRAAADVQRAVQARLIGAYLEAPWPAQAGVRAGELQDFVTVRTNVLATGTQDAAQALSALLNLLVLVVVATLLSVWATAGLLAAVLVVIVIGRAFRASLRRALRGSIDSSAALATEVSETATAARDLRVFGVTAAAGRRLLDRVDDAARRMATVRLTIAATGPLTRDVTIALLVIALAVVVTGTGVALPVLGATVVLVLRALAHAQTLSGVVLRLQERGEHVTRMEERIAAWRPASPRGSRPCPSVERIELREVSFTHPGGERPAVDGVSLNLARGEVVGLVGRTGAGKSTLAGVLVGLLEPDRGSVVVAGVPLEELDPGEWHGRTAWVSQEPHLLTGTVADNIRFLRENVDDEAVCAAADAAGLGDELRRWPHGLDHPVGSAGTALSGGQRQRIALARALAGRPELIVLDEPTSALDAHSEAVVREALAAVRRDMIVVVIAHRLSTVEVCDRLAVIEDGRAVALAPASELADVNAYFRDVLALSGDPRVRLARDV